MTTCQAERCWCTDGREIKNGWLRLVCLVCRFQCHYACAPGGVPVSDPANIMHCGERMTALEHDPPDSVQESML